MPDYVPSLSNEDNCESGVDIALWGIAPASHPLFFFYPLLPPFSQSSPSFTNCLFIFHLKAKQLKIMNFSLPTIHYLFETSITPSRVNMSG